MELSHSQVRADRHRPADGHHWFRGILGAQDLCRPCLRGWPDEAAGGYPRPRGRDVRVRPVGGRGAGRMGRRRGQGRARGDRRPAARPAADRLVAGRGRPQPEHRARQPVQAQRRPGYVGARRQRGALRAGPPVGCVPDQLPARTPQEVRHRRRRHPRGQPEDHLRPRQRPGPARRGVGKRRLRHDRVLVSGRNGRHHHAARNRRHGRAARARLRRHHLRNQPGRRHRGGVAQARAHRRTLDRRRLTAGQRPVVAGTHRRA